jgi:hypothetical protein
MDTSRPITIDPTLDQLHKLFTFEETTRAMHSEIISLDSRFRQTIPRPSPNADGTWDWRSVTPFLKYCHQVVEREVKTVIRPYPSFQWLWYLRRLPPHIFSGSLRTTLGYDSALAETITGLARSNKSLPLRNGEMTLIKSGQSKKSIPLTGEIAFEIDQKVVRHVLKLCAYALFLSDIHVKLRYAGKGATFQFTEHALPQQQPTNEEENAIRL